MARHNNIKKSTIFFFTNILIGLLLSSTSVFANDIIEEEILVTATRVAKSQNDLAIGSIIITRADIENSNAADLADLLRFQAGLDIGRNGGPGQTTSVFIRGTESNHTLVLINGVKMNPGTIGGAAIQNISPEIIERIEIIKGPRSSLYGSEAIGGVINIITRRAQDNALATTLALGSFGTKQITTNSNYRDQDKFASFTLDWKDTDGFASLREQSQDRGHDNLSLNLRAGLNLFSQDFEFNHWQASGNTEYYGFDTGAFNTGPLDQDFNNAVTSLNIGSSFSNEWKSNFIIAKANDSIDQNQLDFFFFPIPEKDQVETDRLSFDWQNTISLQKTELTAGAYFEREKTDSLSFGSAYKDKTESNAIYVAADTKLLGFDSVIAARYTQHETAGNQLSWNTEFSYPINSNLRAGFTAGTAFRAPDATDRYGFGGNPDLKTEKSQTLSAMLNWNSPVGDLNVEIFQTDIDNLIETVNIDPVNFIFQNINIAESQIKGIELGHKINLNEWSIETTALIQSPKNILANSDLLRRARRSLSTHIVKNYNQLDLGIQLLATSKRSDIDAVTFGAVENSGYVLANLTGSYDFTKNISVQAKIENLLDTEYETAAGYQQAERHYLVSLRLNY